MRLNSQQLGYLSQVVKLKLPLKVKDIRFIEKSRKSRSCEYCDTEIPKGDSYYSYKPIFEKRRSRCIDHKPTIYNDISEVDLAYNMV